eukprot:COSAG04_NODE_25645_length_305_cov_0.606796_1_plen_81_part_10
MIALPNDSPAAGPPRRASLRLAGTGGFSSWSIKFANLKLDRLDRDSLLYLVSKYLDGKTMARLETVSQNLRRPDPHARARR